MTQLYHTGSDLLVFDRPTGNGGGVAPAVGGFTGNPPANAFDPLAVDSGGTKRPRH